MHFWFWLSQRFLNENNVLYVSAIIPAQPKIANEWNVSPDKQSVQGVLESVISKIKLNRI